MRKFSKRSGIGSIRRRMARRTRPRGRSSLSRRLEFGPDFKQKIKAHVSHQQFDMVSDNIGRDTNPEDVETNAYYTSYRAALSSPLEGPMAYTDVKNLAIVDLLVRDRHISRYRYARLQKAVFTMTWKTANPPRAVDIGTRVATFNGNTVGTLVPPGPVQTTYYGGAPPLTPGVTYTEETTNYPAYGQPFWQMYMLWDPEARYDNVDDVELRRQGIPTRCIRLYPGRKITWTNYPVRKTPYVAWATTATSGNGDPDEEDGYRLLNDPLGVANAAMGRPSTYGPARYDKRFYPTEMLTTLTSNVINNITAVGWRIRVVPPFWDGANLFPLGAAGGNNAYRYMYDLHTAGYWLFQGDKWSQTFVAPVGSDPMQDDDDGEAFEEPTTEPEVVVSDVPVEPEAV